MRLLKETKMVWLSVYVGNLAIVAALYSLDASFRTIPVIGTIVEVVLLFSFLLMALSGSGLSAISSLAWGFLRHCQIIGSLFYFAASIYACITVGFSRWYLILPYMLLMELLYVYLAGGIKNCYVAEYYQDRIAALVSDNQVLYKEYAQEAEDFNSGNGLGFFRKVRVKHEPKWERYHANVTTSDLFGFYAAISGIPTSEWESTVAKLEDNQRIYHEVAERARYDRKDREGAEWEIGVHNKWVREGFEEERKKREMVSGIKKLREKALKENRKIIKKENRRKRL